MALKHLYCDETRGSFWSGRCCSGPVMILTSTGTMSNTMIDDPIFVLLSLAGIDFASLEYYRLIVARAFFT